MTDDAEVKDQQPRNNQRVVANLRGGGVVRARYHESHPWLDGRAGYAYAVGPRLYVCGEDQVTGWIADPPEKAE